MTRAARAVSAHARHRAIRHQAKGRRGRAKNTFRAARQAVERADSYRYQHRRKRKGMFRRLWIQRLNAAVREQGMTYSVFAHLLKVQAVPINRKMLAELAVNEPNIFANLVKSLRGKN